MKFISSFHRPASLLLGVGIVAASFALSPVMPGQQRSGPRAKPTPIPTPPPGPDDPVTLPFGFSWGDTPEMVKTAMPRVNAKLKQVKPLGDRGEIWVLVGVAVPGLRETRAVFQEKQLVGLDLEYGATDWPVEKFRGAMANLRRKLEAMFSGPGTMLKRGPVEGSEVSGVEQILTGYEWRRSDTIVMLVYFSAEKKGGAPGTEAFRSMTIRYRYQAPVPAGVATPSPEPAPDATPVPLENPAATPAESPAPEAATPTPDPLPPK
ncbi:hypothetical protein AYO41_01295 [Verrucomicrobia bacterium SCGC AG-212-E04]|nr:hypothetical protein AYO41_01295 [Verrucomicrobia bacterium SCGC AG-212-E04]